MANSVRQQSYGNIFSVGTPYIDQLSNRIYADQKQREAYQQQQNKLLDDEFARNLTGIRDADIPELTKAYGDFKQARMQTLNKPSISPDQQLDVLRKKAGIYEIINKSKQQREWETAQGKQIITDKKRMYADDAHQQLINRINTPLSKINTDNDANLLYKYYVPKLDKQIKDAKGTEQEVPVKLGQSKTDPLKDDTEIYKAGNAPDKFANKLLEGVMSTNEGRNFSGLYNNKYDDAQLEDLKNRYAAKVNDPKFIKVYGEPKPLPATDTELGKAVGIRTMEEFADMDIKPTKLKGEINDARATANRQKFAREEHTRSLNAAIERQRIGFNHTDEKDAKKQVENNQWIDGFIDDGIEKSKNYPLIDGKRTVPLDVVSGKAFQKGQIPASALQISDDGQTFTPVYPTYDASGNPTSEPNPSLTQPMDRNGIKLALGYKTLTKKDLGNTMKSAKSDEVQVQIGGKIYKIPKSNLPKMDADKVKYKLIQ